MSQFVTPLPVVPRTSVDWSGRILGALVILGLGMLLGFEYMTPEKRSLSIVAAFVVAGIAWRLDTLSGIGFLMMFMPFPRGTVFGSTNVAFVLLLLIIWLFRITQRMAPLPRRTALDLPILGLVTAYIVSFYNLEKTAHFQHALENTLLFFSTVMMFYLIVNNVRNERQLIRLHRFQMFALLLIFAMCTWEVSHPGQTLFKGWIEFRGTRGEVFSQRNIRIAGPFFDYELLAEYSALNVPLIVFWMARARNVASRTFYGGMLLVAAFVMFATVTRGAMISLACVIPLMLWRTRRRLRVVPMGIVLASVSALFFGMNFYVSHFTRSGDLLKRLTGTQIIHGIPDSRTMTWPRAWQRMLEHPIIGHGPYYSVEHGLSYWYWPHNIYLYIGNLVGFVGLAFFLWMLFKLVVVTWPKTDNPNHPSYAEGYMLVANAQILLFIIDQVKIEYLRNMVYQYQVWLLFAMVVAGSQIALRLRRGEPELA